MTREELKELIDEEIKENGQGEITGPVLNNVLQRMLETLPGQRNPETNSELFNSDFNTAMGENSHAEGLGTKAVSDASHAEGKYNKGYSEAIHEVGIGTNNSTRRDAHVITVDGKHYVLGLGGFNTGNEDLADCEDLVTVIQELGYAVRFDQSQTLTEPQKTQARQNIGAISAEQMAQAVLVEKQRAEAKETDLHNEVLTEQGRAEDVEAELSARIDAIVQGRDVRDIVPNYQALLDYDTDTLGDNDIIMVLLDNTKSDHTTYYRWHTDTQSWEFIGGLAFTYTKTEIDQKFSDLHIVLPVFNEQSSQELLAQVDETIRHAGADAQFKLPIPVEGMSGNVTVTYFKYNPANTYLGIYADDRSVLYHITRTIATPRTYTCEVITKVSASADALASLIKDLYNADPAEGEELGDIPRIDQALADKEDKIFVATYNRTTFNEIKKAYDAGREVVCKYGNRIYHLTVCISQRIVLNVHTETTDTHTLVCKTDNSWTYINTTLENSARRQSVITESDTNYPSSKAVVDYVAGREVFVQGDGTRSAIKKGSGSIATGIDSLAEGFESEASGQRSHAEGNKTLAANNNSHAEGSSSTAGGNSSHAEGAETYALGDQSHAEGRLTRAIGKCSHTEGLGTRADTTPPELPTNPPTTHAENAHAEGAYTYAEGNGAHAEGFGTQAVGLYAHAEGNRTQAIANYSHAEGSYSETHGNQSHAEGNYTITSDGNLAEHAEGRCNASHHKSGSSWGDRLNTLHSVGFGTSTTLRKNAHEIMQNGDHYIYGVGGYDGTNPGEAKTLQQVIATFQDETTVDKLVLKSGTHDSNRIAFNILADHLRLLPYVVYLNTATNTYYRLNTWKQDGAVFRFSYLREDGDTLVVTRFSLDATGKVS